MNTIMASRKLLTTRLFSSAASSTVKPEKFVLKTVRVCVLGAASRTGQALALLLKQNPLISQVYLHDKGNTKGIAADLVHMDTRCDVTGFSENDLTPAIVNANIIVMLGLESLKHDALLKDRLKKEGPRLVQLSQTCARMAPKAILVDCVFPVSVTLPLVSEMYRRNHWYHPGRVIGSVGLLQIRINTMVARYQNLDPSSVHVPLIGGPDDDTVVPLFSRASPSSVPLTDANLLVNRFRKLDDDAEPTAIPKLDYMESPNSSAFAINRLVTTVALGLLGDNSAICTAHVRSNFVQTCRHIVSTVKFGTDGVAHNYGVPRLTKMELKMFEKVTLQLVKREHLARDFIELSERGDLGESKAFNAPTPQQGQVEIVNAECI